MLPQHGTPLRNPRPSADGSAAPVRLRAPLWLPKASARQLVFSFRRTRRRHHLAGRLVAPAPAPPGARCRIWGRWHFRARPSPWGLPHPSSVQRPRKRSQLAYREAGQTGSVALAADRFFSRARMTAPEGFRRRTWAPHSELPAPTGRRSGVLCRDQADRTPQVHSLRTLLLASRCA